MSVIVPKAPAKADIRAPLRWHAVDTEKRAKAIRTANIKME